MRQVTLHACCEDEAINEVEKAVKLLQEGKASEVEVVVPCCIGGINEGIVLRRAGDKILASITAYGERSLEYREIPEGTEFREIAIPRFRDLRDVTVFVEDCDACETVFPGASGSVIVSARGDPWVIAKKIVEAFDALSRLADDYFDEIVKIPEGAMLSA